ncbi:MAG: hypothetical protein V2I43_20840 [Parvularcula sp.]|nr:hypothetical protein [Parvularcula sp.]
MDRQKSREVFQSGLADEMLRVGQVCRVFLAGPFIDPMQDAAEPVNSETFAKALRYSLNFHIGGLGHSVYLGEDEALRKAGRKQYGSLSNAVIYERHHIRKHVDAVVVIPSSPGSFCELGDWASTSEICSKMLVLVDEQYRLGPSYMNDGVLAFCKTNGATVSHLSYSDVDEGKKLIEEHVGTIVSRKLVDELYDRAT